MSREDIVIDCEGFSCKIGKRFLLKDIHWQIRRGEHWAVYGMNGSGKTTLLSILAGFGHYTSGQLKMMNEAITPDNALTLRQKIGFVSSAFFDKHYTKEAVLDIVLSGKSGTLGVCEGITLADVKQAKGLLGALNLGDKIYRGFDMLSKGERQTVLIARALLARPEILLLDEPSSGLDVYNRAHLFRVIEELAKNKAMTMIYVTHYLEEIDSHIFKQALLLKNGRCFAQGKMASVMTAENLSELLNCPILLKHSQKGQIELAVTAESDVINWL